MSSGKSKSTTTVNVPPPTATELALQDKRLQIAEKQLEATTRLNDFNQIQIAAAGPIFEKQNKLLEAALGDLNDPESQARLENLRNTQDELLSLELENIKRGGAATEEEKRLISETVNQKIAAGESDITRFQQRATDTLAQQLAPALGLRPTDTSIVDRAGLAAEEATRQQGQLVRDLRGAEATAQLNFPLARSQLQSAQTQFQQSLAQTSNQFQQNLRESALNNRLRFSGGALGQSLNTGLGIAGVGGDVGSLAAALGNQRVASASRSTVGTQGGGFGIGTIASGLGGVGGLLTGLGAIGKGGGFGKIFGGASSRTFKTDNAPIDTAKALEVVKRLPVDQWRYKGDDKLHLGTYAEDFKREVGVGDGKGIAFIDHLGLLTAAVKGLADKVDNDNPLNLKAA